MPNDSAEELLRQILVRALMDYPGLRERVCLTIADDILARMKRQGLRLISWGWPGPGNEND